MRASQATTPRVQLTVARSIEAGTCEGATLECWKLPCDRVRWRLLAGRPRHTASSTSTTLTGTHTATRTSRSKPEARDETADQEPNGGACDTPPWPPRIHDPQRHPRLLLPATGSTRHLMRTPSWPCTPPVASMIPARRPSADHPRRQMHHLQASSPSLRTPLSLLNLAALPRPRDPHRGGRAN